LSAAGVSLEDVVARSKSLIGRERAALGRMKYRGVGSSIGIGLSYEIDT
jgi:hypothetical protein